MADIIRLSKNFALKELTRSSTAERLRVDNSPNDYHLVNLTHLAINVLQPVEISLVLLRLILVIEVPH